MTNLQGGERPLDPQQLQRLWLGLPIAAGALLAALLAGLVLVPQWLALQKDARRLRNLEELRDQVALMRRQLSTLDETEQKVTDQQEKLFDLVAGSGDLSTFLATLDQEARAAGVRLQLYEPQVLVPVGGAAADDKGGARKGATGNGTAKKGQGTGAAGTSAAGVFEVEGLTRRSVLVSAKGPFPALLRFLRGLEARNVLVVQSDLQMMLEEEKSPDPNRPASQPPVVLKLVMSLYGKEDTSARKPAAAAERAPG